MTGRHMRRGVAIRADEKTPIVMACEAQPYRAMAKLTDEQRRALHVLARHPEGCIDAVLLADGFDVGMLAVLVVEGFADMKITPVEIGGLRAVWLRITERVGKRSRNSPRGRRFTVPAVGLASTHRSARAPR